jgi:preprotein translocase subunit SecY
MLITVGVILDTMKQVETFLLQRHYDGFLKKGRVRARGGNVATALNEAADMQTVGKLWLVLGIIFAVGIAAWLVKK